MSAKSSHKPPRWRWIDVLLTLALLMLSLWVRLAYARAVVFPPLDDPAFYLTTAENVINGRGLEVDVLWSYQIPFPNVTHPSHEHWMPLTTGLIAAALGIQRAISGVMEASLQTGQMPGLVVGALLAPLTYFVGRNVLPGRKRPGRFSEKGSRWVSLGAALMIAVNATLSYQSASSDSSATFALLAVWALSWAVRKPGDQGGYLGVGLLIGLAYSTRSDGLLLLLAIPLAWYLLPLPQRIRTELPDNPAAEIAWAYWPKERGGQQEKQHVWGPGLRNLLDLGFAFALVTVPWLVRNYLAFGTPLPGSVLSQAWLLDYADTFNYWSQPNLQTWLDQGWQIHLDLRVQALLHNGRVLLLATYPWGLLALPGLWLLRHQRSFFPALIYGLILFFGLALVFPVSSMSGTFYHSLGAVLPFLALAAVYTVLRAAQPFRRPRWLSDVIAVVAIVVLLALASIQVAKAVPAIALRHQAEEAQFEQAAAWLAQHASLDDVVMTTQPHTLNYASGHSAIALPANEPPDAAWEAAQRYGARYLVITQAFGQYPQILEDQLDPRFRLLEKTETTMIYEIVGGKP